MSSYNNNSKGGHCGREKEMPHLDIAQLPADALPGNPAGWYAIVGDGANLVPFKGADLARQSQNVRTLAEYMSRGQEFVVPNIENVLALTNARVQLTPDAAIRELFVANDRLFYATGAGTDVILADAVGTEVSLWADIMRVGREFLALL
jgi:hypothetical protein